MGEMQEMVRTRTRKRNRLVAILVAVFALACLAGGTGLVVVGLTPGAPEPAPLPEPFSAASGTATGEVDPAGTTPSSQSMEANRLLVPSLGIYAPTQLGSVVPADGVGRTLEIPPDPANLTIYDKGAQPCSTQGTVMLAGHVASRGQHGALWPLSSIAPNAAVFISCADGTVTKWRTSAVEVTQKQDLPQDLFTAVGPRKAVIITCGGAVTASGHYPDNVIVTLVEEAA